MVGVGKPSGPSEAFLCERWTMPEPGESLTLPFLVLHLSFLSKCLTNEAEHNSCTRSLLKQSDKFAASFRHNKSRYNLICLVKC